MRTLYIVLYVIAAVAFAFAALIPATHPVYSRVNFIAVGLLAWVIIPLVTLARA